MTADEVEALLADPTLQPLAQLAPLAGVRPGTLSRWATEGRGGVHLSAANVGGRWFSTPALVLAFIAQQTNNRIRRPGSISGGETLAEREERGRAAALRVAQMRAPRRA